MAETELGTRSLPGKGSGGNLGAHTEPHRAVGKLSTARTLSSALSLQ